MSDAVAPSAALRASLADRYIIERELGQGGMATVYLARDRKHEREVAIKVLRADLSASLGAGRFLREIKIAAQLQHPHILPLLDSGEAAGRLYFVMPYIKGQSLRERLSRDGELPVHEAVRLISEVVDALVEAHAHGVVHRDIKPDNVMLSGRHALVTDFGVAKAISEATGRNTVTTLGVAVGTPTYMSPEQAAADPHVDHRSDIYSVGVMLYEMLAGRAPFTGATPQQVLAAHVTETPDPVSKRRNAISPSLEQVVMRCLAKRPADRFQTAAELHAALEPLATPSTGVTPVHTMPVGAIGARRWRPLLATGVLVLLAVIGWVTLARRPPVRQQFESPTPLQVTATGAADRPALSPDGTRVAYVVPRCTPDGTCVFDLVVQDIGGAGTLTVATNVTAIYNEAWSPDSRYLLMFGAFHGQWGEYLVPATVQGAARFLGCCTALFLVNSDSILQTAITAPGDTLAWLRVITTADLRAIDSIAVPNPGTGAYAMPTRDGKRLVVTVTQRSGAAVARVIRRDGSMIDSAHIGIVSNVMLLPDDSGLLLTSPAGTVDAYDLIAYHLDHRGHFADAPDTVWHRAAIQQGIFSLNSGGTTLAYAQGTRTNRVISLRRPTTTTAQFRSRVIATSTTELGGGISPDGQVIGLVRTLAGTSGRPRRQLSLMPADSGREMMASPPLDSLVDFTWLRNSGAGILYSSLRAPRLDRVDRFEVGGGQTVSTTTLPDSTGQTRIWSLTDSTMVSTNYSSGRFLVLRRTSGAAIRRIPLPAGLYGIGTVSISPGRDAMAVVGWDPATEDSLVVYRISLVDSSSRQLVSSLHFETYGGVQWLDNGDLLLSLGESYGTSSLYRLPPGGGLMRLGALPFTHASYTFSRDGLRAVAAASEWTGDIWLVTNFGGMLHRR